MVKTEEEVMMTRLKLQLASDVIGDEVNNNNGKEVITDDSATTAHNDHI